ncbi:MAG: peptidase M28, partial [Planctomycetota bacterium JB042]
MLSIPLSPLLLALSPLAVVPPGDTSLLPETVRFAAEAGGTAGIRANVRFLSNDLLEGRSPGTRGGELAAKYLAGRLESLGLRPGGPDGSYFQNVPLVGVKTDFAGSSAAMVAGDEEFPLAWLDEFVGTDLTLAGEASVDAEMVFVGYGIAAPEQGWDDYGDVDVRGKVLLMCVNDPPSDDPAVFGGKGLTYYGRWTYKYEEATRRGAAGAVLIHRDSMAGYGWTVVRNSWGREKPYVDERGNGEHRLPVAAWITEERIGEVLAARGLDVGELIAAAGEPGCRPRPRGGRLPATHPA